MPPQSATDPRPADPSHPASSAQALALFAGVMTMVVWGSNFAVQKLLFEVLPPSGFLFGRYLLMPLCAAGLLLWVTRGRRLVLPAADWRRLAVLGFIGHGMHVSLVTYGIHFSTAFSSALIVSCMPVFTLLLLRANGHERLSRPQVQGVVLACAGVLVFLSDKLVGGQWAAGVGDLVLLFGASLFSYYTVMTQPLIARHGGFVVMGVATIAGCLPVLLVSAWPALQAPWGRMQALHWGLLLWASVVSAFLGWLVWGWVNARRGVARSAPLLYLMPLVAGLGGWWFTGETFGAVKLGGAALALAGVAWAQFRSAAAPAAGPRRAAPDQASGIGG